jgi:hypothetical protein
MKGAAATVDALKRLAPTSAGGQAVKAVVLIGDPQHEPGKKSNVDEKGSSGTAQAIGISGRLPGAGIPDAWDQSGKVLDVCYTVRSSLRQPIRVLIMNRETVCVAASRLLHSTFCMAPTLACRRWALIS